MNETVFSSHRYGGAPGSHAHWELRYLLERASGLAVAKFPCFRGKVVCGHNSWQPSNCEAEETWLDVDVEHQARRARASLQETRRGISLFDKGG